MWKLGYYQILSSNWFIQLSTLSSHFQTKIAHFQDAIWNRSHQSSLSVSLAATHHGCAIENESGLKKTVVFRLHNSTAIRRHFNAAGVISRQLNRLCKYCTVWRGWQYSWRGVFAQLTCWWHSFLILCLYNQSKSTDIEHNTPSLVASPLHCQFP